MIDLYKSTSATNRTDNSYLDVESALFKHPLVTMTMQITYWRLWATLSVNNGSQTDALVEH